MNRLEKAPVCLALATMLAAWMFAAPAAGQNLAQVNADYRLAKSALSAIDIRDTSENRKSVSLQIDGRPVTLFLEPYSRRSTGFQVMVQEPNGNLRNVETPACKTYRGVVQEWERSQVTASLVDGKLSAQIRSAENGAWFVEPLEDTHLVYNLEDVLPGAERCGIAAGSRYAARAPAPVPGAAPAATDAGAGRDQLSAPGEDAGLGGGETTGASPVAAEVSFDADVEFFQSNGSSVTATVDDIERIVVGVDGIYRADVGISYVLNRIVIRTSEPDPYTTTNADDLLDEVQDEWEGTFGSLEWDMVHLMTGKNLDGTTIGIAWVGQVCDRSGFLDPSGGEGLSSNNFGAPTLARRIALTAHEMGHNWDAVHCDSDPACTIMCSSLGGCTGILNTFEAGSRNSITSHRDDVGCLNAHPSTVFVNAANSGGEDGSILFPYNTFREGVWACDPGGTVMFFGGLYDADRTTILLARPMVFRAQAGTGTVVIAQ